MTYGAVVLADSPLLFLQLQETSGTSAADSGSRALAGTYTGGYTLAATGVTEPDGVTALKAVTLNGTSGYVTAPDASDLRIAGNLTLEAWVKPTNRSNYYMIVTKGIVNSQTYEWRLDTSTGLPLFQNSVGTTYLSVNGTVAPPTGVWSHLAVVKNGATVTHYLNGRANGTGTVNTTPTATDTTALYIGRRNDGYYFNGSLSHVALWNSALSAGQIGTHAAEAYSGVARVAQVYAQSFAAGEVATSRTAQVYAQTFASGDLATSRTAQVYAQAFASGNIATSRTAQVIAQVFAVENTGNDLARVMPFVG